MRYALIMWLFLANVAEPSSPAAETDTPTPPVVEEPAIRARAELEKIQALLEHTRELHEAAAQNKEQQECIELRLAKLKGLYELTRSAVEKLIALEADEEGGDALLAQITMAGNRAEKLADEIPLCGKVVPVPNNNHSTNSTAKTAAPTNGTVIVTIYPPPRRYVKRDEHRCINQQKLAFLLAKAMGLTEAQFDAEADWPEKLQARGIEPLGGWQPDKTVDLDDLCVVVGQALKLQVTVTTDATGYCEAVRLTGLPVDQMFPGHSSVGVAPYLLESEVRRFFATGWGSPPSR